MQWKIESKKDETTPVYTLNSVQFNFAFVHLLSFQLLLWRNNVKRAVSRFETFFNYDLSSEKRLLITAKLMSSKAILKRLAQ